jgi:hypothetical protein
VKRVLAAVLATLALAVSVAGIARATIDLADFQAALETLAAVDAELALHAQANSSDKRDFAVGGGQSAQMGTPTNPPGGNFGFSAHSGPAGEDPFGHVSETIPDDGKFRARVTCLMVVTTPTGDRRAGIVGQITESSSNTAPAGFFVRWVVRDTGLPGGEGDGFRRLAATSTPITGCPTALEVVLEHGNINIHDAP